MQPQGITQEITLPDGRVITIETGKLAKQADGSVVVRMGNTMLLATVVGAQDAREGVDFLPLSVDYQEKFASAGKIPGGFLKREGRLSDYEILVSRLVDRAIRPLFPDDYHADIQVNIQLISSDAEVVPDALAALAASAALSISDLPFQGPIAEVRVIKDAEGQYHINPTQAAIDEAVLDLMVAADQDNILMVEGEMKEVSEAEMLEAMKLGHDAIKILCEGQKALAEAAGAKEKRTYDHETNDDELKERMHTELYDKCYEVAGKQIANKNERKEQFKAIKETFLESFSEEEREELDESLVGRYFGKIQKKACRDVVLKTRKRIDGRELDEVRPIWTEVDYLPTAHGSAVFTRGETQSLTTVTLGTKLDEQLIDRATMSGTSKFILHYNFPGFSTGEVKPNRGPGRREVGHGNLALRALKQVLPSEDENPYTIRVVSDILESNGSSSMATVCAGSLALMDAGIKTSGAVSGIAMGLISDPETGDFAVLSDILGDEDALGDMDFKVTGTANGLTACQMDIKVDGMPYEVLEQALEQAKRGREHIMGEMNKTIDQPREDYKPNAPRSVKVKIDKDMIGALIGPGGKVVQEIQKETGSTIVIEEQDNIGLVSVFAVSAEDMNGALARIKAIVALPEEGETYEGKVKTITNFGAFVEFMAGRDGLLHISEWDWMRINSMDDVIKVGETVKVKLIEIDKATGKYRLSRKALLPRPPREEGDDRGEREDRGERGDRGGRRDGGNRGGRGGRR